jgi:hypothetical protein
MRCRTIAGCLTLVALLPACAYDRMHRVRVESSVPNSEAYAARVDGDATAPRTLPTDFRVRVPLKRSVTPSVVTILLGAAGIIGGSVLLGTAIAEGSGDNQLDVGPALQGLGGVALISTGIGLGWLGIATYIGAKRSQTATAEFEFRASAPGHQPATERLIFSAWPPNAPRPPCRTASGEDCPKDGDRIRLRLEPAPLTP